MLQLKPGQRIKVWHKGRGASALGILIEMADSELTLSLEGSITPEQGDLLVLEIPQEEDALYILQASLKEIGPGDTYTMEVRGESYRRQRRQFPRIPTRMKAKFLRLSLRDDKREYLQGEILDISSGGALISAKEPLEVNSELMLMFEFRQGIKKGFNTSISSKVVRKHQSRVSDENNYGVEFKRRLAFLEV